MGKCHFYGIFPYRQTSLMVFSLMGRPHLKVFSLMGRPHLKVFSLMGRPHFSYNIKCFPLWANVIFRGVL
jgi:hypothetical protein